VSEAQLAGNGVDLIRERALARSIQAALLRLYQIDDSPDVHSFIQHAETGERESLRVKHAEDGVLELALHLPRLPEPHQSLDGLCQIIEGVSHFVYVAERASVDREATQLELELQAEVDKYVVLAASMRRLDVESSEALRTQLFEEVVFSHERGSECGDRYRVANAGAAKFARRLEREFIAPRRFAPMREELRRFFRMGQEDKLRLVRAG
jgi:hypothetical protein